MKLNQVSMMDKPLSENTPDFTSGKSLPIPKTLQAKYQKPKGLSRSIKIRNISRGGICIEDVIPHDIGTSLQLSLRFKGKIIRAQGEVTWSSKEGLIYVHGIAFTFMEQGGRQWFNTFVMDWAAEQIANDLDFSSLEQISEKTEMERRSFARLKIPLRIDIGFNQDTVLIRAEVYDLSEGGLCLISNFELKKDQELYLRVWIDERKYISLVGIIKYHSKKTCQNEVLNFNGLEFTKKSPPESLEQIAQFLNKKRAEMEAIEISLDEIVGKANLPELP